MRMKTKAYKLLMCDVTFLVQVAPSNKIKELAMTAGGSQLTDFVDATEVKIDMGSIRSYFGDYQYADLWQYICFHGMPLFLANFSESA